MDKDYVIGVNVPNFITITIMAMVGGMIVMAARKAVGRGQGGVGTSANG